MCASGFSCHYRKFPQTHPDMPKHLCIPITTGKVSSRVKDARSKERPLSSTSQPANIANGDFTPEETDARTVITSFDILRWGENKGIKALPTHPGTTINSKSGQCSQIPSIVQSFKERLIVKNDTPNQGGFLLPVLGHRDLQHLPRYSYLSSSNTLHRTHLHPH